MLKYSLLMFALFRIYETLFYQNQIGTGERRLLRSEELNIQHLFASPGVCRWWRDQPFAIDEEFRRYVDTLIPAAAGGMQQT